MMLTYKGVEVRTVVGFYSNGRYALTLQSDERPDERWVASVNCSECPLEPRQILVKTWSENAGILEALAEAGVVTPTGEKWKTGFVEAAVAELEGPLP